MSSAKTAEDITLDLSLALAADTIRKFMWLIHDVAPESEGKAKALALEGYAALDAAKQVVKAKREELHRAQEDVRKAVAILG